MISLTFIEIEVKEDERGKKIWWGKEKKHREYLTEITHEHFMF